VSAQKKITKKHVSSKTPSEAVLTEERVREIASDVFQKMLADAPTPPAIRQELPPEPQVLKGKPGRRQDRSYHKVTITIDSELWKLFCQERDRLGVSNSRLFDIIVWQRYGKPLLSYQEAADEE